MDPTSQAVERSAERDAGVDPTPGIAPDERPAHREALRALAALIGEEVFY